jgi:hypothetical protein
MAQETIITWDEGEGKWIAKSNIARHIAKLYSSKWELVDDGDLSLPYRRFEHKKQTAIVFRNMKGRVFTDEQKAALSERFAKARAKKEEQVLEEAVKSLEAFDDL